MTDFGSSEAGKKGGRARAEKLTKEQRSEIARQGAIAKWEKEAIPVVRRATHGSADHPLTIGNIEIPCYVLDDSTRVITNRGLQKSLGMTVMGGAKRIAESLGALEAKGLDCKELIARILEPVEFLPTRGGRSAFGYEATVLADLCDVFLAARKKGLLTTEAQLRTADFSEMLVRGFARVGIIALVDEATGYQEVRDRLALQEILDRYLRREFAVWAKRFPDEFYQEIFRLRGWVWRGMRVNRPSCVAQYTRDLVYARLAPGILGELELRNPMVGGARAAKHHQFLTEDIGHPALAQHLHALLGLMRASDSWGQLMKLVNRAFPKRADSLQLELFSDASEIQDDDSE